MKSQPDARSLDPEPDILMVVLARVRAAGANLTEEQARQIEQEVRAELGGLRVRVPKRRKHLTQEQRQAVVRDALGNATDGDLTQRHGIGRATLYRYIKRGVLEET